MVDVDCHGTKVVRHRTRDHSAGEGVAGSGVRPEKIFDRPAGSEDTQATSTRSTGGVVSDVSFIGVSTQYLVRMPWGQELMVFEQNTGQRAASRDGDQVDLALASGSHLHARRRRRTPQRA